MPDFQDQPNSTQFEAGIGYVGAQMVQSSADNLTASTTQTQAGALQLNAQFNRVTTVATAGNAVKLPAGYPGMSVCIVNAAVLALQCYPFQSVDKINGIAGSTGVSQMGPSTVYYYCSSVSSTGVAQWSAQDLGCGTNGNYPTIQYQDALTAGTTQTAAGGTKITSSLATFSTVANVNDAATLPAALPGMQVTVINNGVQTLQVFALTAALGGAAGGDKINAAATAITMAGPPTVLLFYCTALGQWWTK
jgi:hypothetical protein